MSAFITWLNLVVALSSAAAGGIALYRPTLLFPAEAGAGGRFFALMYAARAIPFGLAAGLLPLWSQGWPIAAVLAATALVQLADVGIGLTRRIPGMAIGATIATLVHLACAIAVF